MGIRGLFCLVMILGFGLAFPTAASAGVFDTLSRMVSEITTPTCPGKKTREVHCRDFRGNIVADHYCSNYSSLTGAKPVAIASCSYPCPPPPPPTTSTQRTGCVTHNPGTRDEYTSCVSLGVGSNEGGMTDADNDGIDDSNDMNDGDASVGAA